MSPIMTYSVRLFVVVLQELQCLLNCLHVHHSCRITSTSFVILHIPVLLDVLPEVENCHDDDCVFVQIYSKLCLDQWFSQ